MKIEGSIALVTGANRGLGAEYVRQLLDRGASKVYAGARDIESITNLSVYILLPILYETIHVPYNASTFDASRFIVAALG